MADNAVVITITGDDKELEKVLQSIPKQLSLVTDSANTAGDKAGKGLGEGVSKGAKNGLKLVNDEFRQTASLAQGSFSSIAESFITSAVNPITLGAAAVGAAIIGAFKLAQIGEENEKIAKNFELFATQAGLNAGVLKDKIAGIAEGFVDLEDVLPKAGEAIIALGKNANKLPEIFELARNIGVKTGRDVNEVFEQLTRGVANQNEKMLRNNLIRLDINKVEEEYAHKLGVTVAQLTDAGKQQAVLNATLAEGRKNFSEAGASAEPLEGGIRKLHLAFDDLKDAVAALVDSKLGEFFASAVSATASAVKGIADSFKLLGGDLGTTDEQIARLTTSLKQFQIFQEQAFNDPNMQKFYQGEIDKTIEKIKQLGEQKAALASTQTEDPELTKDDKIAGPTVEEKRKANEDMLALEAEKNLVLQQMQIDHNAALQLIEDDNNLTTEQKSQIALDSKILKNTAEFDAQVEKNKKLKIEAERNAADDLARAKLVAANMKAVDDKALADKEALAMKDKLIKQGALEATGNFLKAGAMLAEEGSELQKGLLIAEAIRSTYAGATRAYAEYPFPASVAVSASVVALGLASVAKIVGANSGALVTGGQSGIDNQPFMLSKGELVAPAKTFDEVVEGTAKERGYVKRGEDESQGGAVTVHVSIQGDFYGEETFINKLAEKLQEAVQFRDASLT